VRMKPRTATLLHPEPGELHVVSASVRAVVTDGARLLMTTKGSDVSPLPLPRETRSPTVRALLERMHTLRSSRDHISPRMLAWLHAEQGAEVQ